jgi:carboxylesterase type B
LTKSAVCQRYTTMFFRLILVGSLGLISAARGHDTNYTSQDIFDCITGPCVQVPGVGKLQGSKKQSDFTGRDIFSFYGIPYAESTAGSNRFQPPVPRGPLNEGKNAYDASYLNYNLNILNKICMQPGMSTSEEGKTIVNPYLAMIEQIYPEAIPEDRGLLDTVGSEDCLSLAIFSPQLPKDGNNPNLPVMVFYHGGSFMLGGYVAYGPKFLLDRDIVLVEVQYRLGPLGFMCLPDDNIAGNMAMLDQVMALQWVQDHISAFGGDPNRVTIVGESAGSASVTYHRISPLSEPLFHQSIAESGSALASWAFDSTPEKHAKDIATVAGCPTDNTVDLVNCLRNDITPEEIVMAHQKYYKAERSVGKLGFGGSVPCAQTHGAQKFITKHPLDYQIDAIESGVTQKKPAIYGANKHEGSFVLGVMYGSFFVPNDVLNDQFFLEHRFISTLLRSLGLQDDSGNIYEMLEYTFFDHTDMGTWDTMMEGMVNLVGVFFIKASTYEWMKNEVLAGEDAYFYSFEYFSTPSLWNFQFPSEQPPIARGVTHGDELMYLFSTDLFPFTEDDWDMAYKMSNLWANFIIHGNPTPPMNMIEGVPAWPTWNLDNLNYMILDSYPRTSSNYVKTWATPDNHV